MEENKQQENITKILPNGGNKKHRKYLSIGLIILVSLLLLYIGSQYWLCSNQMANGYSFRSGNVLYGLSFCDYGFGFYVQHYEGRSGAESFIGIKSAITYQEGRVGFPYFHEEDNEKSYSCIGLYILSEGFADDFAGFMGHTNNRLYCYGILNERRW